MSDQVWTDPGCLNCWGRGYALEIRRTAGGIHLTALPCRCRVLLPDKAGDPPPGGRAEADVSEGRDEAVP